MRNNHEWCYVSGRVNVLGSSLLEEDFFRRIITCETPEEIYRIMSDSPARGYFTQTNNLYEAESLLNRYYLDRLEDISSSSPDQAVCDLFRLRYDFLNLKNYIKEKILLIPYERHILGRILDGLWKGLWEEEECFLPGIFGSSIALLKKNIGEVVSAGVVIDSIIDNAYLCYLLQRAEEIGSPMIEGFIQRYQLIKGTEVIWRALLSSSEAELIPGFLFMTSGLREEDLFFKLTHLQMDEWRLIFSEFFPKELCEKIFLGSPSERLKRFIKEMDDYLLQETLPTSYIPFGPERVFIYLIGFSREIFNLGLAIRGRLNRIPPPLIEERFRKVYV